jgi:hypothetical protein
VAKEMRSTKTTGPAWGDASDGDLHTGEVDAPPFRTLLHPDERNGGTDISRAWR